MIQEDYQKFEADESVLMSWDVPTAGVLLCVFAKFSVAPSTSESFVIRFKSKHGTDSDVVLYSVNPMTDSLTQIVWFPSLPVAINKGDRIEVSYPNTDDLTIGVTVKGLDSSRF